MCTPMHTHVLVLRVGHDGGEEEIVGVLAYVCMCVYVRMNVCTYVNVGMNKWMHAC
jgi:hypothetical protein